MQWCPDTTVSAVDVCTGSYQSFDNVAGPGLVERYFTLMILVVDIGASIDQ